jgi:LDH2 family malate/lactate/ureidoglycolate dehydrogenase
MAPVRVDAVPMQEFVAALLAAAGMPAEAAATAAEVLVRTDLRGIRTHGVRHIPGYLRQIKAGGIDPAARIQTVTETASTATLDAGAGLGHVAAHQAARLAIEKARRQGIAIVLVRNSNHCGAVGHYALMCAEAGLIGVCLSNCPPVMTVTGSLGRVLGNGPTAYAAPNVSGAPIVFDAAMSVVAGGKIQMAREREQPVPEGWIVDAEGRPTTDAEDFGRGGALLPVGDHKGYGLALFGELLAGALSGAAMAAQIGSNETPERPTGTGHAVIAISIEAVMPAEAFARRIATLQGMIKSAPRAQAVDDILLPGETEEREERRAREHGLDLDGVIWQSLSAEATSFGLEQMLERARLQRP